MQIMVCGDSFGVNTKHKLSWINWLSRLLNVSVHTFCQGGCSNYSTYWQYKNNNPEDYDIAIILITNTHRIPIVKDNPHLCCMLDSGELRKSKLLSIPKDYSDALDYYIKYYFNEEVNLFVSQKSIQNIIDSKPTNQKLFILNSGSSKNLDIDCNNSVYCSGSLIDVLHEEVKKSGFSSVLEYNNKHPDELDKINHLSFHNNYNLANFLKNVILDQSANKNLLTHNWTFD